MCHKPDITDSPYFLAIFSALAAALLTFLTEKFISWQNKYNNRKAQLRIIRNYFILERQALVDIQDMDDLQIHPYVNSTIVLTLLRGDYLTPEKDENLITFLNEYVQTTEQINRAFNLIDIQSSGFTSGQSGQARETRQNLKNVVPEFLALVDRCVREVDTKLKE